MAISFVQANSASTDATSATTIAATFGAGAGNGSLIVGVVMWGTATTTDLTSVTDGTNSYTILLRTADGPSGASGAIFYAKNVSGSPTTITANFGSSIGYRSISIAEFSGVDTTTGIDGTNYQAQLVAAPGTGTDGLKSGTGTQTPSANGCVVVGLAAKTGDLTYDPSGFTAGTNFQEPANAEPSGLGTVHTSLEYEIQTTATARNAAWTVTADTAHIGFQAIFKSTSGGASGKPAYYYAQL